MRKEEIKGSVTEYFHADWDNKVIAKLSNVTSLDDELDVNGENISWNLYRLLEEIVPGSKLYEFRDGVLNTHDIFYGTAKCDERDEFDLDTGKKIASLKADLKYHKKRVRQYERIMDQLVNLIKILGEKAARHAECVDKLNNKLVDDHGWTPEEPCGINLNVNKED